MRYYYINEAGKAAGPVEQFQLQELFRQGMIHGESGVAIEGTSEWIPFRQLTFGQQPMVVQVPSGASLHAQPLEVSQNRIAKKVVLAAWLIIGATCLVALIPGVGFLTWVIAAPILLVTFILGFVALNKGSTTHGVIILLVSLIGAPLFLFVVPFITAALAIGGGTAAVATSSKIDQNEKADHAKNADPAKQTETARIGDRVNIRGLELKIGAANKRKSIGKDFIESKASRGGVFVVIDWIYMNASKKPMSAFSSPDLTLLSPDGTEYEMDLGATSSRATEVELDEKILSDLNPGISVRSSPAFEVAESLLAENGWRIQIEFNGHKAYYELELATPPPAIAEVPDHTQELKDGITNLLLEQMKAASSGQKGSEDGSPKLAGENPPETSTAATEAELASREANGEREAKGRIADLKGSLAAVNAKINSERTRYQSNLELINRLTNNKRTPVQEGSQPYYQCVEASKQMTEVQAGVPGLLAEKAKLEATIKELEK